MPLGTPRSPGAGVPQPARRARAQQRRRGGGLAPCRSQGRGCMGSTLCTSGWRRCQASGARRAEPQPPMGLGSGAHSVPGEHREGVWHRAHTHQLCGPRMCLASEPSPHRTGRVAGAGWHGTPAWAPPWAQHLPQLTAQLRPHPPHARTRPPGAHEGPLTHGRATRPGETPLQLRSSHHPPPPGQQHPPQEDPAGQTCQQPPGALTDPTAWHRGQARTPGGHGSKKVGPSPALATPRSAMSQAGTPRLYLPARRRPTQRTHPPRSPFLL